MKELEILLWEIEKRGGRITSRELINDVPIGQYQRALKQLRERLIKKNIVLTRGERIEGQKKNFMYRLIRPQASQLTLF